MGKPTSGNKSGTGRKKRNRPIGAGSKRDPSVPGGPRKRPKEGVTFDSKAPRSKSKLDQAKLDLRARTVGFRARIKGLG